MARAAQLAAALGPRRMQAPTSEIPRSQYLAKALQDLQTTQRPIRSWGELAADLGAVALTDRGQKRAVAKEKAAGDASDTARRTALLGALDVFNQPSPATPPIAPQPQASAPTPPEMPMTAGVQQPMASAEPKLSPDIDALVRTVWGEGRGEPAQGQQAIANVVLNRAAGRGMSPTQVVQQPHQFEPWGNPQTRQQMEALSPQDPVFQAILQNIQPALQGQDVTGGADHFYSPGAQSALGRPAPSWDNGKGVDLGRHRFFDLEQGQGGPQPYDVAAMGQPPAPPQAPQPEAQPQAPPQLPPQGPESQAADPRQQQIGVIRSLLGSPETAGLGEQLLTGLLTQGVDPQSFGFINLGGGGVARTDPRTGQVTEVLKPNSGGAKRGLVPIYGTDAQGQTVVMFPSEDGTLIQPQLPGGVSKLTPGVSFQNLGTSVQGFNSKSGAVETPQFGIDVQGRARQDATGQVAGEQQATAAAALPNTLASTEMMINTVDQILGATGLDDRLGLKGMLPAIPGTPGANVDNLIDQLGGQVFLSSTGEMRGLGALTEAEGKRLVQAKARLNRNQSPADFRQALQEVREIATNVAARARAKAAGVPGAPAQAPAAAGGWTEISPGVRIRPKG